VIDIISGEPAGARCDPERWRDDMPDGQQKGAYRVAVEGKVAKILANNEIVINRGRAQGVRPGMLFEVFAPGGEEVWDPDTGETLGTVEDVKASAEVTEVKERLAVARLQNTASPFGAVNIGEMQENLQRMFGQMFGEDVKVQGFGMNPGGDEPDDLESMLGGPLQDLSQIQVGDAVREIRRR
jgi:hypothetical protein